MFMLGMDILICVYGLFGDTSEGRLTDKFHALCFLGKAQDLESFRQ
jgi:hypothetical protein